jgi:hypothetical protein
MNNETILYILGAGASMQAVPLADALADRILSFSEKLTSYEPVDLRKYAEQLVTIGVSVPAEDTLDKKLWGVTKGRFVEALQWLGTESKRHVSVDTYAKKLFFKQATEDLQRLKAVLSAYLVVEQSVNLTDKRYDSFLATILKLDTKNNKVFLPPYLQIITWNYDTQLEKAFYEFCEDDDHVIYSISLNENIYRVNGYCGTKKPNTFGREFRSVWRMKNYESAIEAGLHLYDEYISGKDTISPDICFAWEKSTRNRMADHKFDLTGVKAVVVIGYSFPYFNREIDEFFWLDLSGSQLRRIYLQYPEGEHKSIENRIRGLLRGSYNEDIEFVFIPSLDPKKDMFYLPEELWNLHSMS